jgi:hypothetical protein
MVALGYCAEHKDLFYEPIDYDAITHIEQPRLLRMLARGEGGGILL